MSEPKGDCIPVSFNDAQVAPCTFQQNYWLWYAQPNDLLTRLDTFAVRLLGPLSTEILCKCIQEIIRRHESLRARIVMDGGDGAPMQCVGEPTEARLETIYVDGRSQNDTDTARSLVEGFARERCDLETGPLFSPKVVERSEREHLLVWRINHLIYDGWSLSVMFRELWWLYGYFICGRPSPLQEPRARFSDYRVWQEQTHQVWLRKHQSYWKERLAGAVGIRWPSDAGASGASCSALVLVEGSFSEALSTGLRELARRLRTLLSLEILTVYVAVLSLFCNQNDFVVQNFINGRDRLEHQHIVGFLAHSVYLRIQLTGDETFIELLGLVSREFYRTIIHKDFGDLVTESPELWAGIFFQWLPWPREGILGIPTQSEALKLGITGEVYPFDQRLVRPESFNIGTEFQDGREVSVSVSYAPGFCAANTIDRFVADLRSTAERFVENPSARVSTCFPAGRCTPAV